MVHIRKKILAWSDEGFRSFENFKTAYSYTQQNFDDFGKYAISVNMDFDIMQWPSALLLPQRKKAIKLHDENYSIVNLIGFYFSVHSILQKAKKS